MKIINAYKHLWKTDINAINAFIHTYKINTWDRGGFWKVIFVASIAIYAIVFIAGAYQVGQLIQELAETKTFKIKKDIDEYKTLRTFKEEREVEEDF